MKKLISLNLFLFILGVGFAAAQPTTFDLNATTTNIDASTLSVKVQVKYDIAGDMGFANYVFSYDTGAVEAPTINTIHNFSGGSYVTMTLTYPTTTTASINIVYNSGTATAVGTSYTDVITMDFNIKDQSATLNMAWDNNASNTINFDASFNQQSIGTLNDLDESLAAPVTWIGTTTAWSTASNWSPAYVPIAQTNVTIPTSPAGGNFPVLSGDISINDLTINSSASVSLNGNQLTLSGTLTSTGTITGSSASSLILSGSGASTLNMDGTTAGTTDVLNNLTLNNSGGLTLSSALKISGVLTLTSGTLTTGGNLTLTSASTSSYGQIADNGGSISGNVTVEKSLSNTNAGWRHFGLPVSTSLNSISGLDVLGSNHSTAGQRNAYYWDATDAGSNVATGWTAPDETATATLGYAIYSNNSDGLHDISSTLSVSGSANTGTKNYTVDNSTDPNTTGSNDDGWNLIPNPYPSNLDISTFWATTLNGINYKAIHIYDQTASQYVAICSTGVFVQAYNGTNSSPVSSTVIAPFQAFWVKSDIDGTISLSNSNRTTSFTGLGTFMKKNYDLVRMNVQNADGSMGDQTVVYFTNQATSGLDLQLEAYKLISPNADVPSLYAISPDGKFSITALNDNEFYHSIPLGFRSSKTGEMTFSLNTSELDSRWYVYLEDKELGIFYDIRSADYVFNHKANSDSRFVLHIQTYALSAEKLVSDLRSMKVSGNGDDVFVFLPAYYSAQNAQVECVDMMGRVVSSFSQDLSPGMNTLRVPAMPAGYYSVRISAREGTQSGKVLIR